MVNNEYKHSSSRIWLQRSEKDSKLDRKNFSAFAFGALEASGSRFCFFFHSFFVPLAFYYVYILTVIAGPTILHLRHQRLWVLVAVDKHCTQKHGTEDPCDIVKVSSASMVLH